MSTASFNPAAIGRIDRELFDPSSRGPVALPALSERGELGFDDLSRLVPAAPVVIGAATLLLAWQALASVGAELRLSVVLVALSVLMTALAVVHERVLLLVVAAVSLAAAVTGAYAVQRSLVSADALHLMHVLLVSVALLAPVRAADGAIRLWLGAELGVLLALVFSL